MFIGTTLALTKFRHSSGGAGIGSYIEDDITPALVLDFCAGFYGTRELEGVDYAEDDVTPTLILDFNNNFFGSRDLEGSDYDEDGIGAKLVLDFNNNFYGSEA